MKRICAILAFILPGPIKAMDQELQNIAAMRNLLHLTLDKQSGSNKRSLEDANSSSLKTKQLHTKDQERRNFFEEANTHFVTTVDQRADLCDSVAAIVKTYQLEAAIVQTYQLDKEIPSRALDILSIRTFLENYPDIKYILPSQEEIRCAANLLFYLFNPTITPRRGSAEYYAVGKLRGSPCGSPKASPRTSIDDSAPDTNKRFSRSLDPALFSAYCAQSLAQEDSNIQQRRSFDATAFPNYPAATFATQDIKSSSNSTFPGNNN